MATTLFIVKVIENMYDEVQFDRPMAVPAELTMEEGVAIALAASDFFTAQAIEDGAGCAVIFDSNKFAREVVEMAKVLKGWFKDDFDAAGIAAELKELGIRRCA
jgi:hypothetical protein